MLKNILAHPRLYIGSREFARIRAEISIPFLKRALALTESEAAIFVKSGAFEYPTNTHNEHLLRARYLQKRVFTLMIIWLRTKQNIYRNAIIAHLIEMEKWEFWSWKAWRAGEKAPDATWDLSYGENASTLAVIYDVLYDSLSQDEKDLILRIVKKWVVPSFIKHTDPESEAWWFKSYKSNWLAVCAGGGGLIALAMAEELPEAKIMLERANVGLTNFMNSLVSTGGGWPEGVAYWNYGMRYAFMFLISYENATQLKHPSFNLPETIETLRFPPAFSPYGNGCGFGDISDNPWLPIATHYAVAERLNCVDVLSCLDSQPHLDFEKSWATAAELLALHPGKLQGNSIVENKATIALYKGLNWGYFADAMPSPSLYVSVRGGTSSDPHNMPDLLSWHCLINGERLIASITNHEYIDTTFSNRRFELSELRQDTKNNILIGGVGLMHPATIASKLISCSGHVGFFMDATSNWLSYNGLSEPAIAARLFLFLENKYVLILDRVKLNHTNRVETRVHSYANLKVEKGIASLIGEKEKATIVFASNTPCLVATSLTTPTKIEEKSANVLRFATIGLEDDVVLATLLVPGTSESSITIKTLNNAFQFDVIINAKIISIKTDFNLG
jgi:hypothetical protein